MVCRHVSHHVYHPSVGMPQGLHHPPGSRRHQSISFSTVSRFERLTAWPASYIGHVVSNGNKFQPAGGCRRCQRWDESDQYEPEAHTTRSTQHSLQDVAMLTCSPLICMLTVRHLRCHHLAVAEHRRHRLRFINSRLFSIQVLCGHCNMFLIFLADPVCGL